MADRVRTTAPLRRLLALDEFAAKPHKRVSDVNSWWWWVMEVHLFLMRLDHGRIVGVRAEYDAEHPHRIEAQAERRESYRSC